MRPYFILLLLLPCALAHADAYKCKDANGNIEVSSSPCAAGTATTAVAPSEQQADPAALDNDPGEAKKQEIIIRHRQPGAAAPSKKPRGNPNDRSRIHDCLTKATAVPGVLGWDEGQRKIECYRGTTGLQEECESRMTETLGLTADQERRLRQQCRSL
ncbi:MAG: DUF4124 domain-containing protein [Azonexus sp.]|jgi:hypothetical protein|nr:DUF4124 domain-containing protein [Azonexus sp.]